MLLHALILEEPLQASAVKHGVVSVLVEVASAAECSASQGTFATQKLAMHALILLATSESTENHKGILTEMVACGIVPVAVVAMKADDEEAVYWALGLLHEIAVQHVGKDEIKATPRLVPTMQQVLGASEAATQKIVLRTAGFLAIKDAEFKRRLLVTPFLERLIVCLSSSENEVAHWSIVLLHDVAMLGAEACEKMMESPQIIHAMASLVPRDPALGRLAAETFGFLCAADGLQDYVVDAGLLDGILLLSRSTETELHFWAAALLLNLLTSDHAKRQMVRDDIIHALMGLVARNDRKEVENMATKTLVVLSMFNDSVARRVQAICFAPLLRYLTDIDEESIGGHAPLFARMGLFLRCDDFKCEAAVGEDGLVVGRLCLWLSQFVGLSPWGAPHNDSQRAAFHAIASNCTDAAQLLVLIAGHPEAATALLHCRLRPVEAGMGTLCSVLRPLFLVQEFLFKAVAQRGGQLPFLGVCPSFSFRPKTFSVDSNSGNGLGPVSDHIHSVTRGGSSAATDAAGAGAGAGAGASAYPTQSVASAATPLSPGRSTESVRARFEGPVSPGRDLSGKTASSASAPRGGAASPRSSFESPTPINRSRGGSYDSPNRRAQSLGSAITEQASGRFSLSMDAVSTPARPPPTPTSRSELASPRRESLPSYSGRHPEVFTPRTRWLTADGANSPASAGRSRLVSGSSPQDDLGGRPRTAPNFSTPPRGGRGGAADEYQLLDSVAEESNGGGGGGGAAASGGGGAAAAAALRQRTQSLPSPAARLDSSTIDEDDDVFENDGEEQPSMIGEYPAQDGKGPEPPSSPTRTDDFSTDGDQARGIDSPSDRHSTSQAASFRYTSTPRAGSRGSRRTSLPRSSSTPRQYRGSRHRGGTATGSARAGGMSASPRTSRSGGGGGSSNSGGSRVMLFEAQNNSIEEDADATPLSDSSLNEGDAVFDAVPPLVPPGEGHSEFDVHPQVNLDGTFPPLNPLEVSMDVSFQSTAEEISGIDLSIASDITLDISNCSFVEEPGDEEDTGGDAGGEGGSFDRRATRMVGQEGGRHRIPPSPLRGEHRQQPVFPPSPLKEPPEPLPAVTSRAASASSRGGAAAAAAVAPTDPNAAAAHGNTHKQHMLRIFKEIAEQIVVFSALLSIPYRKSPDIPDLAHLTGSTLWATMYGCPSPKVVFHAVAALTRLASPSAMLRIELPRAEIDVERSTARLMSSCDRLTARNDSWGFESARSTVPAHGSGVWYYEVVILSKGIVQVGWAKEACRFEPENGLGVGDNVDSCSYDGHRRRAWHGTGAAAKDNDYGEAWGVGDVVGCILDGASGTASFTLNGRELGVAFTGLSDQPDSIWYPAVSLSSGQQVNFNFGRNGFWFPPPTGATGFEDEIGEPQEGVPILDTSFTFASAASPSAASADQRTSAGMQSPAKMSWPSAPASVSSGEPYELHSNVPIPIIYYEVSGLGSGAAVGYQNAADQQPPSPYGSHDSTGQKYCASIDSFGKLNIAGTSVGPLISEDTHVGCGVSFEKVGSVAVPFAFFTVDGVVVQTGLKLGAGRHRIFPWLSAPRPRPNFCQKRFAYAVADERKQRGSLAKQLAQWANAAQVPPGE